MSHSRVSPSSAGQWVYCTGMVEMIKDLDNPASDSAIEGDTAHWLASKLITEPYLGDSDMIGTKAPNGHIIDKDMFDYISPYVRDVISLAGNHTVHIEKSIQIPRVHDEAYGTPDCWYFDSANDILYIWDLKYG